MQIIVRKYEHYNRALGTHVKSKDHYESLMKQGNYIPYEEQQDRVKDNGKKPFELSQKGWDIIKAAKNSKDKHGRVKLSDRTIDAMKEIGAVGKKVPEYMKLPSAYMGKGGFSK